MSALGALDGRLFSLVVGGVALAALAPGVGCSSEPSAFALVEVTAPQSSTAALSSSSSMSSQAATASISGDPTSTGGVSSATSTSSSTSRVPSTASVGRTSSGLSSEPESSGTGPSKACLPPCESGDSTPYVDCVVQFKPAPHTAFAPNPHNHDKLPQVVQGPPGGNPQDVVSLGCGGSIVLGFVDPAIVDRPGPDFLVFENPFVGFYEPGRVEVSDDGCQWFAFPCDPKSRQGCAGAEIVAAKEGNDIDPTDPALAGGDAFDLSQVGLSRARFVRITDVSREHRAGSGQQEAYCDPSPLAGGGKGGFDLDAVAIVGAP